MTPAAFLAWFVPLRTLFGVAAIVIALVMLHTYSVDRWRMRRRKVNGIVEAIISGEMRDARLLVMVLVWLTVLSGLGWARLYREPPVVARDAVGAVVLGITLAHIGVLKALRWRGYFKLVELAEAVAQDAKAERGREDERGARHDVERLDDRVDRAEVAKTLKDHIERGITAASNAYEEANDVNKKIAKLTEQHQALLERFDVLLTELRARGSKALEP